MTEDVPARDIRVATVGGQAQVQWTDEMGQTQQRVRWIIEQPDQQMAVRMPEGTESIIERPVWREGFWMDALDWGKQIRGD